MKHKIKTLFIVKRRQEYGEQNYSHIMTSGLFNSASFVSNMLNANGIQSKLVEVIDNNCIDKEVYNYKPTHVIIEAIWVVPSKLELLARMYPEIKWIVRIHSNTPFIAMEGIAIQWINDYLNIPLDNVFVAPNSRNFQRDLDIISRDFAKNVCLPNYYEFTNNHHQKVQMLKNSIIHIGCFGAIRPLKNQLIQAISAISFAEKTGNILVFHINGSRVEQNGSNVIRNLRALFEKTKHLLVEHDWLERQAFLNLIRCMDINMQVSFTETFNIITADSVNELVPVVVSKEVSWIDSKFYADPTSSINIANKLLYVYKNVVLKKHWIKSIFCHKQSAIVDKNRDNLYKYNKESVKLWMAFLKK